MALGAQATDVRRTVMMSGLRWLGVKESASAHRLASLWRRFSKTACGESNRPIH